jgi:hypothetical protein
LSVAIGNLLCSLWCSNTRSARFNVRITLCAADAHVKNYLCAAVAVLFWVSSMGKKSQLSRYLAELGRKGGKTTARRLTPEQRKENARKAAQARWAKQKGIFSRDTET